MRSKCIVTNEKHDQWSALHSQIQDLLAGFADDMLDEHDKQIVEAHLAGCEACRMDVVRQQLLSHRLNELPVARMPMKLHQQIDKVLREAPIPEPEKNKAHQTKRWHHWFSYDCFSERKQAFFVTASGWAVALMVMVVMLFPQLKQVNEKNIPMVDDVIAKYQKLSQENLPTSLQNGSQEAPATWSGSRVLAHWKTTIEGKPSDAYAVRDGNNVVFQFKVSEEVFFRNPDVRLAIENTGNYQVKYNKLKVLALPLKKMGLLIVGPNNGMPTPEKLTLKLI